MGQGRKTGIRIDLSDEQRRELESWQRCTTMGAGLVRRGRLILLVSNDMPISRAAKAVRLGRRHAYKWLARFLEKGVDGLADKPGRGRKPVFPPEVAAYVVRLACERPDLVGRSLSQWDCAERARQAEHERVVVSISSRTVQRILLHHKLKPWRHHRWFHPKHPRDEAFYEAVQNVIGLYTRELDDDEVVLSVDEKTSLQPRPRATPTKPAQPGNKPNHVEHEYKRAGALQLLAAFDSRSGHVYGRSYERKRQIEFIEFLSHIETRLPGSLKTNYGFSVAYRLKNLVGLNGALHEGGLRFRPIVGHETGLDKVALVQ